MGYTLYTNSDFDALVSIVLLQDELTIDEIIFVEPSQVTANEIVHRGGTPAVAANIPPFEGLTLWFDHHLSNINTHQELPGLREVTPSCARAIENYYQRGNYPELLAMADRIDTADFTAEDLLNPPPFDLVSITISGNVHDIDAMAYNRHLVTLLGNTPDRALADPQVKSRVQRYLHDLAFVKAYITEHTILDGPVAVVDLRGAPDQRILESSFKFLHYAAQPEATIAIRIYHPNLDHSKVRFQVGRSIIHPHPSNANVAAILKPLGGGGHAAAGGCTVEADNAEETFQTILCELKSAV